MLSVIGDLVFWKDKKMKMEFGRNLVMDQDKLLFSG